MAEQCTTLAFVWLARWLGVCTGSFGDVHLKLNLTAKAPRQSVAPALPIAKIIPRGFSLNPLRLVRKLNPFSKSAAEAPIPIESYRVVKTTVRGPKRWTVSPLFCCGAYSGTTSHQETTSESLASDSVFAFGFALALLCFALLSFPFIAFPRENPCVPLLVLVR